AQDTLYVGTVKGVGRIYHQTFIDTYAKVVFAKLYHRKMPLTAADLFNDQVLPFYEEHHRASRVRAVTGVENIDHTRRKTWSPQTNGICERFPQDVVETSSTGWRFGRTVHDARGAASRSLLGSFGRRRLRRDGGAFSYDLDPASRVVVADRDGFPRQIEESW